MEAEQAGAPLLLIVSRLALEDPMTTTDHAIVAPAVTGDPGTRDDAGGFDPGKPVRKRTGARLREPITVTDIFDRLCYNPETGILSWRDVSLVPRPVRGKPVGRRMQGGYIYIKMNKRGLFAHRAAWVLMTGDFPQSSIDHINADRSDNRWLNLRSATHSQNKVNSAKDRQNSTGMRGVKRLRLKFQAQMSRDGKRIHLGTFDTAEAAHEAYLSGINAAFGDFVPHRHRRAA